MQHSSLQLYHNYKGVANNFLRRNSGFDTLYQKRTPGVLVANSFVQFDGIIPCKSRGLYSGILLLELHI